jgi:hypothetical protein
MRTVLLRTNQKYTFTTVRLRCNPFLLNKNLPNVKA